MNQKRAKAIRRSVYGDVSIREKREYRCLRITNPGQTQIILQDGNLLVGDGQIVCANKLRRQYQLAKKS